MDHDTFKSLESLFKLYGWLASARDVSMEEQMLIFHTFAAGALS